MTEIIIAFLTGVLGPISILLIKHYLNKKTKKDPLPEAINHANLVSDEIDQIMADYSADRVWIAQFHNGGNYYPTGKSIQKFSIFFEAVKQPRDTIKLTFQNVPVNLFAKPLSQLYHEGTIVIPDFKDENTEDYGLRYFAEDTGAKSTYIFGIKTLENRLVGAIAIEYTSRKKKLSTEEIAKLQLESAKLGCALVNHLHC